MMISPLEVKRLLASNGVELLDIEPGKNAKRCILRSAVSRSLPDAADSEQQIQRELSGIRRPSGFTIP